MVIEKRKFSVDDIINMSTINDVRISNNNDIAFSFTKADLNKNKNVSEIQVILSSNKIYFLTENDSTPRWSPSGDKLAFISRRGEDEKTRGQALYIYVIGGEVKRLSWFKFGVLYMDWFNEDKIIVLSPKPVEAFYDEDNDYVSTDRLPLWMDESDFIGNFNYAIYLVDINSGYIKEIANEPNYINSIVFCKNYLYYSTIIDYKNPLLYKVIKVDINDMKYDEILSNYTIESLRCFNDKLYLLMHKGEIGLASHFKLYEIGSDNKINCLTCKLLDRNIVNIIGSFNDGLALIINDSGSSKVILYKENSIKDLFGEKGYVYLGDANGKLLVYAYADPIKPMELYLYDGNKINKLTKLNEFILNETNLINPIHETFMYNGRILDGWVMLPNTNNKVPLILYIHGGPKSMYGYNFYPEMQLMVSNNFAVAFTNPLGSDGYEEKFAEIRGKYGEDDFNQIIAFLDYILNKYSNIDRDRLGVTGISYGGFMTNVMITKTNRFKAAISENGIADWIADYYASDIGYWFNPDQIGDTPQENLDEYIKKSPAYFIDNVKTPVLFIHSMQDYRCFVDQSLAMHTSLVSRGKDSRIIIFNKGSHGHSTKAEPRHRKKRYEIKLKYFNEKLKI